MINKIIKYINKSFFSIKSPFNLALASSIGIFIGMLPLIGIRLAVVIFISLIFGLNIISLLLGFSITIIFPGMHLLSFWIGQRLAGFEIPYFSLKYLYFSHLLQWTSSARYHLVGSILIGLIFAILLFPIFKYFYSLKFNKHTDESQSKHVFYDNTGHRWSFLKRMGFIFLIIALIVTSVFGISLSINPFLPDLGLRKISSLPNIMPITQKINGRSFEKQLKREERHNSTFQIDFKKHSKVKIKPFAGKQKVFAFYVNWDESSLISFKRNISSIDVLVPEWYHINKDDSSITGDLNKEVQTIAQGNNTQVMPLINNFLDGSWNEDILYKVLSSNKERTKLINNLTSEFKKQGYAGINIDFESLKARDKKAYELFMEELYKNFHNQGMKVTVDVPPQDEFYNYSLVSKYSDYVIVMMYDEHYESGAPGPIASDEWFQNQLDSLNIPPQKLIISLGNYGYDWTVGSSDNADALTFGDIMQMADQNKLNINWDDNTGNPYLRYKDNNGQHIVWFLDGPALYNEVKMSKDLGPAGFGMWRLGAEDPSIWKILKNKYENPNIDELKHIKNPDPVQYIGQGEILRIISKAKHGNRSLSLDKDGYISDESYDSYPTQFKVERYGKPKGKVAVLTFDDGPDPQYTPEILDILKKYNVKGSFFIVGENAEVNPEIIERIYKEGHEIGNHTFTHPNVALISPMVTKMELNATQRLIQELTGHSTVLFRAPYVADAEPSLPNELLPVLKAQEFGYTMIGEQVDPNDWQTPPPDVIVNRTMNDIKNGGNIILLHDAGGDRSNTVKALPQIIEKLKAQGYKFETTSDLLGKSRDDVMPATDSNDDPFITYDKAVFGALGGWRHLIADLFYIAIVLGIFRLIFLVYFSGKQHRESKIVDVDENYKPFVSVVIAAYNEEKVICKTIDSILNSDYDNFEILIVDDGSKDDTYNVAKNAFKDDLRVRVITKQNAGKSSAVNVGFKEAKGEIVVALDADTIISRDAISLLIGHFKDENVGAVSGNVKVGNVHNLITLWQHIEYVTGFNLERRAFAKLNCITVVPGAIGAWRKDAVKKVGYYSHDTLAEDTDITLDLLQSGYKIEFEENALAYTESPDTVKSLIKQRYRWSFGTLQCLWKHREALFSDKHKMLGFVALPNMWIFQYVFQSISPIADIYFIMGLFGNNVKKVLIYYIAFLIVDYAASIFAFRLEKEKLKPLLWLIVQRLIYRQFMTYVVLKSIFSAFKGIKVGWNKLQRMGNVK